MTPDQRQAITHELERARRSYATCDTGAAAPAGS
jgi:hypothetical protein